MRGHKESPLTIQRPDPVAVHPRLAALFGAFTAEGLTWCLLRGETELDGRPGDVDILVATGDLDRLRRAARTAGFVRLPAHGYGSHLFLIAYDRATDRWLKLDVVTELAFGPSFAWRVADGASVLERCRWDDRAGAWVLTEADAFWALLLHGLLDKRRLDEAERVRLGELAPAARAARDGGTLARAIGSLMASDWVIDGVVEAVTRGEWDRLDRLGPQLETALLRRHGLATDRARVERIVGRRVNRLARVRRPRGLTVALVGDPVLVGRAAAELGAAVPMPVRGQAFPPRWPSLVRGLRIRLRRGTGLVVYRAAALDDLPARRGSPTDLLSCPPPDLVILLGPSGPSAPGSDISTVDATLPEGTVRRSIAGLVWDRLADRWNALDRRSAEP